MADEDFHTQLQLEAMASQQEQSDSSSSDPYTHVDPNDGTVYHWNSEKQAWFPKIDDDFIAAYQSNYQYQEQTDALKEATQTEVPNTDQELPKPVKRKANDPSWFDVDDDHNTNVYVSNLPLNITEEDFIEFMSKCGLIMKDPVSMKFKIKLYRDNNGQLKGDGLCCYIKIESVQLALDLLDGAYFQDKIVHVERAQFELKGSYDPSKKPKKKKKDKEKLKKKLDKLFDWRPDKLRGMRSRNEKTVIIKNMFDPKEFETDATLIIEYQKDLREECSKCGNVKKVVVYDRNPEGVASVTFAEPEMADECINLMNKRWFAGRLLSAETWDGKTKYKVIETEEERNKRIKEWETFLQSDEKKTEPPATDSTKNETFEAAAATDSSGESGDDERPEIKDSSDSVKQHSNNPLPN